MAKSSFGSNLSNDLNNVLKQLKQFQLRVFRPKASSFSEGHSLAKALVSRGCNQLQQEYTFQRSTLPTIQTIQGKRQRNINLDPVAPQSPVKGQSLLVPGMPVNHHRRFSMSGVPAFTIRDCRRARAHRPGSSCPPTETSHPQGFPSGRSRSVHKPFVHGPPKRWKPQTSGETQGSKPLCRVPTLQNWRCTGAQKSAKTKGFLDQNRPKRCLPHCSNLETTPKIPPVHMAGHSGGVCVPSLWAGQCTSGFYKTFKTGGRTVAKDGNKVTYLPRRYPDNVRNQGVSPSSYYHDCQLVIQPRVCHKRRKVSLRAH